LVYHVVAVGVIDGAAVDATENDAKAVAANGAETGAEAVAESDAKTNAATAITITNDDNIDAITNIKNSTNNPIVLIHN
jgi:hypothetical protein